MPSGNLDVVTGPKKTEQLSNALKMASLSDSEIQQFIEMLLNKQGSGAVPVEWTKVCTVN